MVRPVISLRLEPEFSQSPLLRKNPSYIAVFFFFFFFFETHQERNIRTIREIAEDEGLSERVVTRRLNGYSYPEYRRL